MTTEEALVQIQRLSGSVLWEQEASLGVVDWPELIFIAGHQAGTGAGREPGDEFMAAIAVLLGVEPGELLSVDQMIERLDPPVPDGELRVTFTAPRDQVEKAKSWGMFSAPAVIKSRLMVGLTRALEGRS